MTATLPLPPSGTDVRPTAADLRVQWSSAQGQRRHDPAPLERLRGRVEATLAAITQEIARSTAALDQDRLARELSEVRAIAASIARADARALVDSEAAPDREPEQDARSAQGDAARRGER